MQTIGLNGGRAAETRFCYWINSSIKRERTTILASHHQSRSPGGFVWVCGRDSAREPKIPDQYCVIIPLCRRRIRPWLMDSKEPAVRTHQIIDIPRLRVDKEQLWNIFSRGDDERAQSDCFAYKNVAQVMRNQTQTQTNREDMLGVPNATAEQQLVKCGFAQKNLFLFVCWSWGSVNGTFCCPVQTSTFADRQEIFFFWSWFAPGKYTN